MGLPSIFGSIFIHVNNDFFTYFPMEHDIYIHIHMIWCFFLCREVAWELSSPCAERVASMLWQWLDDWRVFWCGEDEGSKRNIFMGTRHFMNSCDSGEHEGCFFFGGGDHEFGMAQKLCIYMVLSNEDRREVHGFGKRFRSLRFVEPFLYIFANWWILGMGQVLKTLWRSPNSDFGAT